MSNTLRITIKNVYGKETIYPICDTAIKLAEFKGQKTFTENDIKKLKDIGYDFQLASVNQLSQLSY